MSPTEEPARRAARRGGGDPSHSVAAFQAAWIDRAFGAPIRAERLAWLARLGVGEDLLAELRGRPARTLHRHRSWWTIGPHRRREPDDDRRAERALAAGLPAIAAKLWSDAAKAAAARAAARTQIERLRAKLAG